jgi:hypothetical protein
MIMKCIKPTHLLYFHLRRLDYCVHASGGGGKGGKVDQANGSFPVTPSLTIDEIDTIMMMVVVDYHDD